jgi:hypothetical protein
MNLTLIDDLGNMNTPGNFYVFVLSIDMKSYDIIYWKPFDERLNYEIETDPDLLNILKIETMTSWSDYDEMMNIIQKSLNNES